MKKFQLCYEIPGKKNNFIAPQRFSDNQPEYDWNESQNLILRYAYPDFMPKGIITRFKNPVPQATNSLVLERKSQPRVSATANSFPSFNGNCHRTIIYSIQH